MTRQTAARLHCDHPDCTQAYPDQWAQAGSPLRTAARAAGWRHQWGRDLCPAHSGAVDTIASVRRLAAAKVPDAEIARRLRLGGREVVRQLRLANGIPGQRPGRPSAATGHSRPGRPS